jgi:hypothetical protein
VTSVSYKKLRIDLPISTKYLENNLQEHLDAANYSNEAGFCLD